MGLIVSIAPECWVNYHLHAQTCKARNFNGLQALVEKAYMEANFKVGVYAC